MVKKGDEVAWAMLRYELEDAQEHINALIQEMSADQNFSEVEFGIHMAHIYAHLNRAWHMRTATEADAASDTAKWQQWSQMPSDLQPL
jgi:hypothetical protein